MTSKEYVKSRYAVGVVGSGPTGLTLANLIGLSGVNVLLIERNLSTVGEARAVSIDDEALRTMQAAGLIDEVQAQTMPYGSRYLTPSRRCFVSVEPTAQPYGYPRRSAFRQSVLEHQLRAGLERFSHVTALYGTELTGFTQSPSGVQLTLRGTDGGVRELTCDYLVGCDGAASGVRGLLNLRLEGDTFEQRWLIVDLERSPLPLRHSEAICDPRRPFIVLPGPQDTCRFEFKLHRHESDEMALSEELVNCLLGTYELDERRVVVRKVVYRFHARLANRWSRGRVFLAGDAAHLTPPFAGQGMNSGIRDAHNLAWKLAAVVRNELGPGLLQTYEQERRNHVAAMIRMALRLGRVMVPRNRLTGLATRLLFRALSVYPPARAYLAEMKYRPLPKFRNGFLIAHRGVRCKQLVGSLFIQPFVLDHRGARVRLDDISASRFTLLVYGAQSTWAHLSAFGDVWDRLRGVRVGVLPPGSPVVAPGEIITVVAEDDSFAKALGGRRREQVVLLRPDHYVAACFAATDAMAAAADFRELIEETWAAGSAVCDFGAVEPDGL
jgi:3-(3-hydroxy-phenyl)propionate hydroxylase